MKSQSIKNIIFIAVVFIFGSIIWGSFLLTGCTTTQDVSSLKQVLEENPDILTNAIRKNPQPIMEAINDAAQETRKQQLAKAQQAEDDARAEARKNPKTPEISDDRVIFGEKKGDVPITIVEYSDFQCGYCGRAYNTIKEIIKKYEGKVRVIYKHLPLDFHPMAKPAAHYYEAIALQNHNKAQQFHDKIFEQQSNLTSGGKDFLDQLAKEVGANMARLKKDLESDKVKQRVENDDAEAKRFGFNGTPGFLINGVPLNGAQPLSAFEAEFRAQKLLDE